MKKIGLFEVLKRLSVDNKNIKAFYLSENLKSANAGGSSGWGSVSIAVDNATIHEMALGDQLQGVLIVWTEKEYFEAKAALEQE